MDRQLHLLTGAYALNALDPQERESFETGAVDSEETLSEVRSLSETAARLAENTTPVEPPAHVKANIMAAIRQTPQLPATDGGFGVTTADTSSVPRASDLPARTTQEPASAAGEGSGIVDLGSERARRRASGARIQRGTKVLAAAAAALLVTTGGLTGVVVSQNNQQQQLEDQVAAQGTSQEKMQRIFSAPDLKTASQTMDDGAKVTVTYSASEGIAALAADGLPRLPADKGYELWLIGDDGAAPMGMLDTSAGAANTALIEGAVSSATHVGITVEPAGGSPQPTTDPILLQEL